MNIDDRVDFRRRLKETFTLDELEELCFDLGVDRDDFPKTKSGLIRELILYFERMNQINILTKKLEANRPGVDWETRVDKQQWLKAFNFKFNPFDSTAFKAEVDNLLELIFYPPSCFIELQKTQKDIHHLVLAPAGGGKTSVRIQLKKYFDENLNNNFPENLRILSIDHVLSTDIVNHSPVEQICGRIDVELHRLKIPAPLSKKASLEHRVKSAREASISRIYIFVDNIKPETFSTFSNILANNDILTISDLSFVFFLSEEISQGLSNLDNFSVHHLTWNQKELRDVLKQRLLHTLANDTLQENALNSLRALFEDPIQEKIIDKFTEVKHPRAMWQLGYYLLKEHFDEVEDARRSKNELIQLRTFDKVQKGKFALEQVKTELFSARDRLSLSLDKLSTLIKE